MSHKKNYGLIASSHWFKNKKADWQKHNVFFYQNIAC